MAKPLTAPCVSPPRLLIAHYHPASFLLARRTIVLLLALDNPLGRAERTPRVTNRLKGIAVVDGKREDGLALAHGNLRIGWFFLTN